MIRLPADFKQAVVVLGVCFRVEVEGPALPAFMIITTSPLLAGSYLVPYYLLSSLRRRTAPSYV